RAERRIALALGAVASGADLLEGQLAARLAQRIVRASRERQHVVGDVLHALLAERRAEGRHRAGAPVGDRGLDGGRFAAIQPVAVGEVRKSARAAAVGSVALRAVVEEELLPDGERL